MTPSREVTAPRTSVVIPVKDDAEHLAACLALIELQVPPVDEVIVVDNASVDGSGEVARRAGARVVLCDVVGIPAAAAHGYDAAKGDVILRLDADCRPEADWARRMLAALDRDHRVAAVSSGAIFVDGPRALRRPLAALYLGAYVLVTSVTLGHPPVFGSSLAMRRGAWQAVRAHVHRDDPELHDDLDLAFHLGERHRVRWLRESGMGMSMRPFAAGAGFSRRIVRGARTVAVHWPRDFPPFRWVGLGVQAMERATRPSPARASEGLVS